MVHATARSRTIIDKLHPLGLSISYNRTMQISTNLANSVCERYESEELVYPPQLRKNVFTTAAMDNLDHNPSSTTAIDSFHGTAISLTNHVSHECRGESPSDIRINDTPQQMKIADLPYSYSFVPYTTAILSCHMWTLVAFLQVNCFHQLMNERLYGCTMFTSFWQKMD